MPDKAPTRRKAWLARFDTMCRNGMVNAETALTRTMRGKGAANRFLSLVGTARPKLDGESREPEIQADFLFPRVFPIDDAVISRDNSVGQGSGMLAHRTGFTILTKTAEAS